jgi:hypothetical protein
MKDYEFIEFLEFFSKRAECYTRSYLPWLKDEPLQEDADGVIKILARAGKEHSECKESIDALIRYAGDNGNCLRENETLIMCRNVCGLYFILKPELNGHSKKAQDTMKAIYFTYWSIENSNDDLVYWKKIISK